MFGASIEFGRQQEVQAGSCHNLTRILAPPRASKKANIHGITHKHTSTSKIISNIKVMKSQFLQNNWNNGGAFVHCGLSEHSYILKQADVHPPHPAAGHQHIDVAAMGLKTQPALTKWRLPSLRLADSPGLSGGGVGAAAASVTAVAQTLRGFEKQFSVVPFTSCGCSLLGFTLFLKTAWLRCCCVSECAVKLSLWTSEQQMMWWKS